MEHPHLDIILAAATLIIGGPSLHLNDHSEFMNNGECYGHLHVGVDEDAGKFQILDAKGRGLMELQFFDEA